MNKLCTGLFIIIFMRYTRKSEYIPTVSNFASILVNGFYHPSLLESVRFCKPFFGLVCSIYNLVVSSLCRLCSSATFHSSALVCYTVAEGFQVSNSNFFGYNTIVW